MLKKHKNALFGEIEKAGYDPNLFEAEETKLKVGRTVSFFRSFILIFGLDTSDDKTESVFVIKLKQSPLNLCVRNQGDSWDKFWYKYNAFMPGYPEMSWRTAPDVENSSKSLSGGSKFGLLNTLRSKSFLICGRDLRIISR